jgi:hypothetical protein
MQCSGKVGFGAESSLYTCDEGPKKLEDRRIKTGYVRTIFLRYRLRIAKWFVWRYMTLKKKLRKCFPGVNNTCPWCPEA